ncbi:hypothetical protein PHYSODRAFT_339961 [Phytophthora sojae]|uniref:Uncharacterized protein n=1 Tax=Phytophthora sojae (strain P6497) TaxID=1094619 RepID=G5A882_PHYSP|nr:hypothetical protein PHYSODRAFT_339961 [Phytophthora sojae]EGZ08108.1 hypothetical protein PHYSODRAFT_339961 [Phytophthora sojae]|eukprot:XP_009536280.1 hypothetical protein PHYSODRAFT_339961 [Phytophthora sojae]
MTNIHSVDHYTIDSAVAIEERWGFLLPWCEVLKGRIEYRFPKHEEGVAWATRGRYLCVILPEGERLDEEDYEMSPDDEVKFQRELKHVQEALALLSVVAYVDYKVWRYLLETHCGLYSVGQSEEARYANVIVPRFLLKTRVKALQSTENGSFNSALVQFCGTSLYDNPSDEYLDALSRIAALDPNLTSDSPGVDVKVPVRVRWHRSIRLLEDIWRAEQTIREQWQEHAEEPMVPPAGSLRCTFKLEPMEADFSYIERGVMAELLEELVTSNARFSQFSLHMREEYLLEDDNPTLRKLFVNVITRVFDNVRRPIEEAHYTFDVDAVGEDIPRLQLGAVHLDCRFCSTSMFEAFCSAMVVNQTTAKLSIKLRLKVEHEGQGFYPFDPVRARRWWKWIAYAFFSKRARACSSLKSLALMRIESMSIEDMEAFTAVVKSEHPEEELFDRPRGLIKPRDATLKSGAPIRWKFDDEGEPNLDWDPITLESDIPFVRTFSDDGTSEWVDAIIPGLGQCQVQRDDLEVQATSEDGVGDSNGGVTSL